MLDRVLAELVLALHMAFILFAVGGAALAFRWPRVLWLHVPALLWAASLELAGWTCPLTPLEQSLRAAAGSAGYEGGFVEHYLLPVVYPAGLTRGIQVALGLGVLLLNVALYGVLWRRRAAARSASSSHAPG
ncbi:MAG: DUF2784 domain-containing protein [Myxococcota bacterium]|nr:DUF2784 domain-containing protein [Myxococcota bacterium]